MLRRHAHLLLPALTAAVILLAGARLIDVSVHERAAQMRLAAETVVTRHVAAIEEQIGALEVHARIAAGAGVDAVPEHAAFFIDARGTVLGAPGADAALAGAIANEWVARGAAAPGAAASPTLFGPVRYGSQWIVAALAPMRHRTGAAPGARGAWVVAFADLDTLLARASFGMLVREGYDFQLFQPDPSANGRGRVFLSSQPAALTQPATAAISRAGTASPAVTAASAAPAPTIGSSFLTLAIEPRGGWYPARDLAAEIGLLALTAWALTFGVYDLTHALKRTRAVLAATHRRLHAANTRLVHEIEEREELQRSFEQVRYHDAFTGLPNRRYFMDQLDRALREVRTRRRRRIALVLLGIERFKLISNTLGHTAGDELLLQAAQRCASVLGHTEHLCARLGSDQLAVLLYAVDSAAASQTLADRLQELRHEPFELRQHRISVNCRAGFTCTDTGLQRAEEALREADLALSVARQHHSERAVAYELGMGGAAVSLVSLAADLHVALDRGEFRLLYQPIVDLRNSRVVGAEALLRWRHPSEGVLAPDRFLAIAEEEGVIVPVTRWVIQRVCQLAAEWRQRLSQGSDFYISINLSGAALRSPALCDFVAGALRDAHIPPGNLKFELSESGIVSNVTAARTALDALHDAGIELMLDDFGTGYSSLSYLQLFPFDYVKIDRPLVSRTGSERANHAITAAILQMASNLGLQAIAEIVETPAAAQTLLDMGCDFGQGYFFSPPVEAEEAFRQLRGGAFEPGGTARVGAEPGDDSGDDSPTLILPPDVLIESRIRDDSGEAEEQSSTT